MQKDVGEFFPQYLASAHTEYVLHQNLLRAQTYTIPLIKKILQKGRILDFGCGSGEMVYALSQAGFSAYGFDPSDLAVQCGRNFFSLGKYIASDMSALPHKFDAVICSYVLQYVPDKKKTFDLMVSRIKPGGFLFIEKSNPYGIIRIYEWIIRKQRPRYEFYDIPAHPDLQFLGIFSNFPAYVRFSDRGLKKICKKIFSFFERMCARCKIYIAGTFFYAYQKR